MEDFEKIVDDFLASVPEHSNERLANARRQEEDLLLNEDPKLALVSENDSVREGCEPQIALPTFEYGNYKWPRFLQDIIDMGNTQHQRDVLLLGALTAIGSAINSRLRTHYNGKWYYACLMIFVVAPPASGKGVLSWVRRLVEPIHDDVRSKVEEDFANYRKVKAAYDIAGKAKASMDVPVPPRNRMFIISANNSGTGMMENIMDADGRCIIFETEADTLSTSLNQDYNHGSDILRNTFDHERISYNRRTDHEYRELKETFLSMVLSGTPNQVKSLIPSAENGLFSRFLFYYMPGIKKWENQFDVKANMEDWFKERGAELKALVDSMDKKPEFTFELSEDQKEWFNGQFENIFNNSQKSLGQEIASSVLRLAPEILRIMSIVALLRAIETNSDSLTVDNGIFAPDQTITISDQDFFCTLSLVNKLYAHATQILSLLPAVEVYSRNTLEKEQIFNAMDGEFTRAQFLCKAQEMNINERHALTWLKRALKAGTIAMTGADTYTFVSDAGRLSSRNK